MIFNNKEQEDIIKKWCPKVVTKRLGEKFLMAGQLEAKNYLQKGALTAILNNFVKIYQEYTELTPHIDTDGWVSVMNPEYDEEIFSFFCTLLAIQNKELNNKEFLEIFKEVKNEE